MKECDILTMKKWVAKSCDANITDMLIKETSVTPLCASVLNARGFTSKGSEQTYLHTFQNVLRAMA